MKSSRRTALLSAAAAALVLAGGGLLSTVTAEAATTAAAATAGCRVTCTVGSQWNNGFTAAVDVTNLGDPISGWQLAWRFPGSQQVSQSWNSTYAQTGHILLHEMGHTFGLDDFYDWDPLPNEGFIMKAGSATVITEFDKWMLRDFWRHLKNRWSY